MPDPTNREGSFQPCGYCGADSGKCASTCPEPSFHGRGPAYRTIVADPPWAYPDGWPALSTSPQAATRGYRVAEGTQQRRSLPYDDMTVNAIAALPVSEWSMADAHLFLWTTNRYLRDAFGVAEAWGFRPSQVLTWCKPPKGIGPGGVFANSSEFCVYARRGKPEHFQRTDRTWWEWPRSNTHSRKPEAFLDLVESVVPGPYLELFSRRARLGWDTWGNESLHGGEAA